MLLDKRMAGLGQGLVDGDRPCVLMDPIHDAIEE